MAELLFETYVVSSVGRYSERSSLGFAAFGVDAAFSYKYNQKTGLCYNDGLAICAGFTTSHIIPGYNHMR
ncbi:Actin-related protein 5 [Asimina triloba]